MYNQPLSVDSVLGDSWVARIKREHERHAGIPDFGYCPGMDRQRPEVRMVSSADLAQQRQELSSPASQWRQVQSIMQGRGGTARLFTFDAGQQVTLTSRSGVRKTFEAYWGDAGAVQQALAHLKENR